MIGISILQIYLISIKNPKIYYCHQFKITIFIIISIITCSIVDRVELIEAWVDKFLNAN